MAIKIEHPAFKHLDYMVTITEPDCKNNKIFYEALISKNEGLEKVLPMSTLLNNLRNMVLTEYAKRKSGVKTKI